MSYVESGVGDDILTERPYTHRETIHTGHIHRPHKQHTTHIHKFMHACIHTCAASEESMP